MAKKFTKIIIGIIILGILLYLLLIIDTHGLMKRAKKIFLLEIPKNEIEDKLTRYSFDGYFFNKDEIGKIKLILLRPFTFHNYREGIIVIYYTHIVYDTNGEVLTGSSEVFPVIWKIKKINNIWNVVDIKEDP